jgi:CheY-like chemotaxis protein
MTRTTPIVLVASADERARQLAALALSHVGLRAEPASNGEQALLKMEGILPTVVVADAAMPGMDGLALRDYLRAAPRTRNIPVLVVKGSFGTWLDAMSLVGSLFGTRQAADDEAGAAPPSLLN